MKDGQGTSSPGKGRQTRGRKGITMVLFVNILWLLTSVFMILVVLVQRGKGGGLAGALGGMGGSSAFGTKAGDVFTKITVVVFVVWLLLAMVLVKMMAIPTKYTGANEPPSSTVRQQTGVEEEGAAPFESESPQSTGEGTPEGLLDDEENAPPAPSIPAPPTEEAKGEPADGGESKAAKQSKSD